MPARLIVMMALLGLAVAAPARAGDKVDPFAQVEALLATQALLRGVVREEDVTLLFAHLRAVLLAAQAGREPPPPEALNRRAEAIAGELKARGTVAGLVLLTALEAAARQALREALTEPRPPAAR